MWVVISHPFARRTATFALKLRFFGRFSITTHHPMMPRIFTLFHCAMPTGMHPVRSGLGTGTEGAVCTLILQFWRLLLCFKLLLYVMGIRLPNRTSVLWFPLSKQVPLLVRVAGTAFAIQLPGGTSFLRDRKSPTGNRCPVRLLCVFQHISIIPRKLLRFTPQFYAPDKFPKNVQVLYRASQTPLFVHRAFYAVCYSNSCH